ncbi:hypothetical protein M422DRAFT_30487 [Sphaerobolus stellatus SS14]|uniref:Uncharacterized protein n=1 Tax=Sphaerobolus stellatus (strain SS14) TaxID=990650 RepID=A0A0C9W0B8_SPHS4|nr:hypothetical protein M422DRAFT_30487 [Sphaerobolus stellatus SS14]
MVWRTKQIQLPKATLTLCLITLALSLLSHVIALLPYIRSHIIQKGELGEVSDLPAHIRPASITLVKSPRLGLYANDSDWDSLIPEGSGFVYDPGAKRHFLLSYYHQLYCLGTLRKSFLQRENLTSEEMGHVDNCFIYLRQMVLCNVDLTLEAPSHKQLSPGGVKVNAVTGIGITHRCRDWSQLRELVEDNYHQWRDTW